MKNFACAKTTLSSEAKKWGGMPNTSKETDGSTIQAFYGTIRMIGWNTFSIRKRLLATGMEDPIPISSAGYPITFQIQIWLLKGSKLHYRDSIL